VPSLHRASSWRGDLLLKDLENFTFPLIHLDCISDVRNHLPLDDYPIEISSDLLLDDHSIDVVSLYNGLLSRSSAIVLHLARQQTTYVNGE
jgi:hypothetical protein